ncbi:type I restriction endonuclease subunit R [Convivina intestini]|uniref:type I site-specific deoxyribonuclease n=1 Tax=Convivina intestini TaxID=1505726 RepID=A0A2U1D9J1_9LACO|nr:type I restriction endonuclease subunit R [Convivina intestini]PVY84299.1 type I restriction enzyme R subunit [Convivina intestini]CAH1855443.1 Type-1 restriction enzyme R protein [Convivina intestini]SDB94040.1 type I restriction enzyme, R subunit [Leuconostocaceae bacterium R-53105]
MAEEKFELAVIEKLTQEGWTYRDDLSGKTEDVLYDHWREILNRNNRTKLEGKELSDNEFRRLVEQVNQNKSPYAAQLLLAGAGGKGTLPLIRDDGSQLSIEFFYGDEVAGGHSEYEVVRQITFNHLTNSLSKNRRIDLLLLINGLPVAHVEEKDEHLQNQWGAFEQLRKYNGDGMYTGLMSFVQVQFILSQHSAHYLARPKNSESYNQDFIFGWRDDNGRDVTDTMEFIHQVMGIPALHRLVTVNMIPDASNDNLMVMRSYQIQATRAIMDRMRAMKNNHLIEKEGGYIWHTTGSGKTVTSFKVAQLLASMDDVKHVIFIVDRVDLVNQTAENFKNFAYVTFKNRIKIVNGNQLKRELKKKQAPSIFLITVQGLSDAVKRGWTDDQRLVILMDEAHRSASGDSVKRIKQALPNTTWFGFTGTPNFYSDEVNDVKTTREVSTHDVFGPRLHRYTIKDAIGDGNVLGFDVTYYETDIEHDASADLDEKQLEKEVYASHAFRQSVAADIVQHWQDNSAGPIEMGHRAPNQFQGMLAVSGKQAVADYYNIFKEIAPDLRVAMTYSRDESNGAGSSDSQENLKKAMADYVERYQTANFIEHDDPERDYLNDITKRLARKKPYNRGNDDDRLDLVIVSDQLLTGFDSKYLNIIYLDKLLQEGLLIQAMSRTNRTFDKNAKPHGKVRFYRKGQVMEDHVREALVIYTKGGNDTQADAEKHPSLDDQQELFNDDILAPNQASQIQNLAPKIKELKEMAGDDFSKMPMGSKAQIKFAHLAAEVNQKVQRLVQQGYAFGEAVPVFDGAGRTTDEKVTLSIASDNDFSALQARLNDVNQVLPDDKKLDLTNIKIALDKYASEIIDYDLLVDLLNQYMDDVIPKKRKAVEEHITPMDQDGQDEISEILDGIERGDYQKHFDVESLKVERTKIRSKNTELALYKWAADHNFNGNQIIEAYDLYQPGFKLNDTPELNAKLQEIEIQNDIGFFEIADFEEAIIKFFASLQ